MKTNSLFYIYFLRPACLFICFFFFEDSLNAREKTSRALIIGIDIYKPANETARNTSRLMWRNLGGCVNDAGAIRDLVISRYSFLNENIRTLFNQEASRQRILDELERLISVSEKGDVVLIYYAGHGSQVYNSLSVEEDKKDESLVPADAYKGAKDIRDKELAGYLNRLLDKGVLLTVILDSCHSGSAGRGNLYEVNGIRNIDPDDNDVKDPSDPLRPEERGALIISAAQDDEFAKEVTDENRVTHGAFTLGLLRSLQQNAVDAPAAAVFSGLQAIIKYYGKTQEPVLAGNEERKKAGIFGISKGAENSLKIPVLNDKGDLIELMGGFAFGLSEGQMLKAVNSQDTLIITSLEGSNRSKAKQTGSSKKNFLPGTLFEPVNWVSSVAPALKIYIPSAFSGTNQMQEALAAIRSAKNKKSAQVINDLTTAVPSKIIHFNGSNWWYDDASGQKTEAKSLSKLMGSVRASVFINIPPDQDLLSGFKKSFSQYNNIQLVNDPSESLYSLTGRLNENNEVEYAFTRNNFGFSDSLDMLPLRTDYEAYTLTGKNSSTIEKLTEHASKIARIRNWMLLQNPEGVNKFPFELKTEYYRTGKVVENKGVRLRDTLSFFIEKVPSETGWNRKKRFVYIFSIDANGSMKLVYPSASKGNVENKFPRTDVLNKVEERTKLFDMLVKPPAGNDAYFMLSSEEAISNLSVFQQTGVVSRGPAQNDSAIESLLFTGAASRNKITTPLTWSIQKIVLHISKN